MDFTLPKLFKITNKYILKPIFNKLTHYVDMFKYIYNQHLFAHTYTLPCKYVVKVKWIKSRHRNAEKARTCAILNNASTKTATIADFYFYF